MTKTIERPSTPLRTRSGAPLHTRLGAPLHTRLGSRLRTTVQAGRDEGAATAEYVVATMAAVGFAGLLVIIMRSDEVRGMLTDLVRSALTIAG